MHPSTERLGAIAAALDTRLDDLTRSAAQFTRSERLRRASGGRGDTEDAGASGGDETGQAEQEVKTKDRIKNLQQDLNERTVIITELGEAYNRHQDGARDRFSLPFVATANAIDGVPSVPEPPAPDEESARESGSAAAAGYRIKLTHFRSREGTRRDRRRNGRWERSGRGRCLRHLQHRRLGGHGLDRYGHSRAQRDCGH